MTLITETINGAEHTTGWDYSRQDLNMGFHTWNGSEMSDSAYWLCAMLCLIHLCFGNFMVFTALEM